MTWPTVPVVTTNVDATTDDPELGVVDIKSAFDKLNQIIAHVSTFVATVLDDADAAAVRITLGLGALATLNTVGTSQIDADAVTYAKIQNVSATDKLLGRSTAGSGDVEEIACTSAARSILDDATVAAILATLGGAPLASPTFTGVPLLTMGSGSGTASLSGIANVNLTTVGNVGAGEDDLISYTLPANSLNADGRGIRVRAWGRTANNANSKTLQFYFGTAILTAALPTSSGQSWSFEGYIVRTGSNAQKWFVFINGITTGQTVGYWRQEPVAGASQTSAQTDSAGITVKLTAQATSNNDIVQEGMIVEYF